MATASAADAQHKTLRRRGAAVGGVVGVGRAGVGG